MLLKIVVGTSVRMARNQESQRQGRGHKAKGNGRRRTCLFPAKKRSPGMLWKEGQIFSSVDKVDMI